MADERTSIDRSNETAAAPFASLGERALSPISTDELERRWAAVRSAMEDHSIDVLVVQNNNDHMGGYVRYLCDLAAVNGGAVTVVFPRDDAMTLIMNGPFEGDRRLPSQGDGFLRGVGRVLTAPSFASVSYSRYYEAELAARALAPYAKGSIGLVCTYQMSLAMGQYLNRALDTVSWSEASELVDRVRAIKSTEEQERLKLTAALQDAAIGAAFAAVEVGKRDSEIAAVAQHAAHDLGAEQGIFWCASAPPGAPAMIGPRQLQGRRMRDGDVFALLVETNGPGGLYAEIGRTCVLGPAPEALLEEFEFTLLARRHCLGLLKPGAECSEVWGEYNAFLRAHGRPEERRLHCHSQGCDMVERPLVRFDETFTVARDMNFSCHPLYIKDGFLHWVCDNYLVGGDEPERLHAFPERITEL